MFDAIERARAERRLALKLFAVLLTLAVLAHFAAGWLHQRMVPDVRRPAVSGQQQ